MNTLIKKSLFVSGAVLFALSVFSPVYADQPVRGSFTASVSSQNILPINAQGHILRMAESAGMSKSTSGPFLDGWSVVNKELNDLTQGNGPSRGHVIFTDGANSVTVEWTGMTSTVLAADGTPMTESEGKWSYTAGTGGYTGISGNGSFKQIFTSETDYIVTYDGFRN
ncbi:MAG: hypothetical protein ACKE9I_09360 [Methylophagaceae bacterium]